MSPEASKATVVEDVFTREQAAQTAINDAIQQVKFGPKQPGPYSGHAGGDLDDFGTALAAAALAIANADRALRRLPPVTRAAELRPDILATCTASAIEAVLLQHPAAVLEAVNDAAAGLFELVTQVITDPDAAIVNDDDRLRDACRAWVRGGITTLRESLAAQLSVLRSAHGDGGL